MISKDQLFDACFTFAVIGMAAAEGSLGVVFAAVGPGKEPYCLDMGSHGITHGRKHFNLLRRLAAVYTSCISL